MRKSRPRKGEAQKASPLYFDSIQIEKLVVGGAGMGRLPDGRVVFIPDTAPGDVVSVEVTQLKKNFAEGRLVELKEPAKTRRSAPCPVATQCGGCSWQHIQQEEQLNQKQIILTDLLNKFLKNAAITPDPIIPSPKSFHYRNRIQPKIRNHQIGFFGKSSHQLVPTQSCLIAEEPLSDLMAQLPINQNQADLELYLDQFEKPQWRQLQEPSDSIGFSQVNRFQNEQLIQYVQKASQGKKYDEIYDLYAGSGNFSFPLMQIHSGTPLVAVELSENLVLKGRQKNQSSQLQFIHSDVGIFLKKASALKNRLMVLDPPRAGCGIEAMRTIQNLKPRDVIYISCHPASLARDLQALLFTEDGQRTEYYLKNVQAFEMFPQTDHFETIAVLSVDTSPLNVTF